MAEVLAQFSDPLRTSDGSTYVAQACGAPNQQGLWEGWIEFVPVNGGQPLRSSRETTQPNRTDAEYWATGLTMVYLEGALDRALNPPVRRVVTKPHAMFHEPSPGLAVSTLPNATGRHPRSVLGLREGESSCVRSGRARGWHLVNIARAYGLTTSPRRR